MHMDLLPQLITGILRPTAFSDDVSYLEYLGTVYAKCSELVTQFNALDDVVASNNAAVALMDARITGQLAEAQAAVTAYLESIDIVDLVNTAPFVNNIMEVLIPPLVTNYFEEKYEQDLGIDCIYLSAYLANYANDFDVAMSHALEDVSAHGTIVIPNGEYNSVGFTVRKPCRITGFMSGWCYNESNSLVTLAEYKKATINFSTAKGIVLGAFGIEIDHISLTGGAVGFIAINGILDVSSLHANILLYEQLHDLGIHSVAENSVGIKFPAILLSTFKNIFIYGVKNGFEINTEEIDASTTLTFNNVWIQGYTGVAYDLHNVYYSSFVSCAADSNRDGINAYKLTGCKVLSFLACGCEYMEKAGWILTSCESISINGYCAYPGGDGLACGAVKLVTCTNIKIEGFKVTNETATVRGLETDESSTWLLECTNFTKMLIDGVQSLVNGKNAQNYRNIKNVALSPTAGVVQNFSQYVVEGSVCRLYAIFVVPGTISAFTFTAPRKSLFSESGTIVGPTGGTVKVDVDAVGYVATHSGNFTAGTYTIRVEYTIHTNP